MGQGCQTLWHQTLSLSPGLRLQDRTKPLNFWEWIQKHPEIPIILTEGEKKAASLLSQGFVAIALPGIWNGRVGKKDLDEWLHPDLLPLAQVGRTFLICFDFETKPKTQKAVYQATCRTAKVIEAAGCLCEIALLPGPEKGVDDLIVAAGDEALIVLEAIFQDALSLKAYQERWRRRQRGLSLKYRPDITLNVPYLCLEGATVEEKLDVIDDDRDLAEILAQLEACFEERPLPQPKPKDGITLPESGLVVIVSDMGTGKTELMHQWRKQHPHARFLNNGHRVNLLKNLSQRLDTDIYSALYQGNLAKAQALSITVDSLHKLQTQANTYDCVFIDEACQYLAHLLHSKTCQEYRATILEVLEYIIGSAQLVVLADAHMDDVTVDFFRALRPAEEKPFIIKNRYQNGGRSIYFYEGNNNSALIAKLFATLMLGLKVMVVSDSKRLIKKLEALMSSELKVEKVLAHPELETHPDPEKSESTLTVWSIHAENSGSEENIAFIQDISTQVKNVDVLLASPSLSTGVDIADYHFDAVFGVFHAVSQTATECAQALHRYRPKVPTHIWVAPRPPFGYQETNAQKIKDRLLESNAMTAFLIRIDKETGQRGVEKDWALEAYCQIQAQRHQSLNNLRQDLRGLLEDMGHQVIEVGEEEDETTAQQLKTVAKSLDRLRIAAIVNADSISPSEYLSRQYQDYLKPEEVYECEKHRIGRAYGLPITEELVSRDRGGFLMKQLQCLEAMLFPSEGTMTDPSTGKTYPAPPSLISQRDLDERERLLLCFDWRNHSSQWLARTLLGLSPILQRLIEGEEVSSTDPSLLAMRQIALQCRAHLKAILGFTIPLDCSPIWLLGLLLDQLGLKLVSRKKGGRGTQVSWYRLREEELTFALTVLAYRQQQRQEKAKTAQTTDAQRRGYSGLRQTGPGISSSDPSRIHPPLKKERLYSRRGV